ncbi:MAG: thiamine diphosphokinase [Deltaproteobacteria bacterium HGW-Deltaproteobacteria-7]|jgi:thiamine pyrophosphokinase|nr:MAG: thiamine diphosphokinase [Deltaproteobacteria bacterium HGW-Deltaproteobacteria-7]PKN19803.1 MAG: thiamine diphosphokinase [Deltaproteobacteria bacterium HGW-Deltaproteobacteria-6]
MHQHIVIVSGGRLGDMNFFRTKVEQTDNRLLICCDGGARHLTVASIIPDVLVGDMDSLDPEQLTRFERLGVNIIRYPVNKDFTDTALALDYAMSLQPEAIDIWGAQGGRIDHALANLFLLLRGKEAGIKTRLLDEYCEMFIADSEVAFADLTGCLVSLIALSPEVKGVTLQGFLYPLNEATLSMSESRGVSNIIQAEQACIRVRSGHLLVIRYRQKDVFPEAN